MNPQTKAWLARAFGFTCGNFILAAGIFLTVRNPWGPAPWDSLHLAVTKMSGLSLGTAIISVSLSLFLVTFLLGGGWSIRVGTIINTLVIGVAVDFYRWVFAAMVLPDLVYLFGGIFCISLGTVLYTRAGFGAGARDGVTLVLSQRLPITAGRIRLIMEALVAVIGWLLGGPLGPATAVIVLTTGPLCDLIFRVIGRGQLPADVRIPERKIA